MKYFFTFFMFFALLSCSPKFTPSETVPANGPVSSPNKSVSTTEVGGNMEESILNYINDHRRSKGLGSLQMNSAASSQAYEHSKDMGTGRTGFGHDGFEQRVAALKRAMGVTFMSASAENVAYGQLSAQAVVKGWLNSSGHRKNIEGNYTLTGIGVYKSRKGDLYFTQIFLRK